jgi:hypothetical protein
MTEYNALVRGYSLKEVFPEKVKIDDYNTLLFRDAEVIFTEFDRSVDAMFETPCEKGLYVGVKVTAVVRTFTQEGEGKCSVTEKPEQYGEFAGLSETSSLKDVVEVINELAMKIRDKIDDKPTEA